MVDFRRRNSLCDNKRIDRTNRQPAPDGAYESGPGVEVCAEDSVDKVRIARGLKHDFASLAICT
jgi:hypothetical protein